MKPHILLIMGIFILACGTREDDIVGIDATLDVAINGQSIDAIVENVAQNKLVAENPK